MKYIIIGLGVYGTNLALDLTDVGAEVIGVDNRSEAIEHIKDDITTTYLLDTTDEDSIAMLPVGNVDVVIVTIGNNFGASIKTVAILKKNGVKRIFVRAIDALHEAILESMKVERILHPEKKSAFDLVNELALGVNVESFAIDNSHYILKFEAPEIVIGKPYSDYLDKELLGMRLIAATRLTNKRNIIGVTTEQMKIVDIFEPNEKIEKGDILTVFGPIDKIRHILKDLTID